MEESHKFLIYITCILLLCVIVIEALFNYNQIRTRVSQRQIQRQARRARDLFKDDEE